MSRRIGEAASVRRAIRIVVGVFSLACGGGVETPGSTSGGVASLTVSPTNATIEQGDSQQFSATPKDAAGASVPGVLVQWASSNTAVVTIDAEGLVTAHAPGTSTLTAAAGGRSATAQVTVVHSPVASIDLTDSPTTIRQGTTAQLVAVTRSASGTVLRSRAVAWSTSDPTLATVSSDGVVTAVAPFGTVRITATAEGATATVPIDVWWVYSAGSVFSTTVSETFNIYDAARNRDIPVRLRLPTGAAQPLPVIFVLPPPAADGQNSQQMWGSTFASAGYAVIHVGTPDADLAKVCAEFHVPSVECASVTQPARLAMARDVSTLIDSLTSIAGHVGVRLDPSRIGVSGWSAGAGVAMSLVGATVAVSPSLQHVSLGDSRIAASLGNSAPATQTLNGSNSGFTSDSWASVAGPTMTQTSAGDAPGRRAPYEAMPPGDKYLAYFDATDVQHTTFSLELPGPLTGLIATDAIAFFDAYLARRSAAKTWLTTNQLGFASARVATMYAK